MTGNGLDPDLPATGRRAASPPAADGRLPPVQTLLLAGERDLSTPLVWARRQATLTPSGRLMVFPRRRRTRIQARERGGSGLRATVRFLRGDAPPEARYARQSA